MPHPQQMGKRPMPPIPQTWGDWMNAQQAARDLRRLGMLTPREMRMFRAWIRQGTPKVPRNSPLDMVLWSVWMWQMRPASSLHQ